MNILLTILILITWELICEGLILQPDLSNNPVHFADGEKLGDVGSHSITEASGLAASRLHSGILYTHNDKGDSARIFAIRTRDGHKMAEFNIQGAHNYDWEDLAIGTCPDGGSCLYIADIGDHGGDGAKNIIYRVREPATLSDQDLPLHGTLRFTWSEPDAETLMVDPRGEIYIVSKVQGGKGKIGHIPNSYWNTNLVAQITRLTTIGIPTSTHPDPVAGDISPNGREVLIKTRDNVYYWYVPDNNYSDILAGHPISLPYIHENRGEAVCWDENGQGYYTLGEGSNKHIYYYRRIIPI